MGFWPESRMQAIVRPEPIDDNTAMDLARAIARLFIVGFDGPTVTPDARRLIDSGVGGVILFARNVASPEAISDLCRELKEHAGSRPLLTCIDQEGGRVARLRDGFTSVPSMRTLGQTGDASLAHRVGQFLAAELRAVNVDMDFAPVLDVDTNPANPVIADQSLGRSPEIVSTLGVALIEGLQAGGVAACAKHFPGHGDTSQDSHLDLPRLPHDMARLESVELVPFAAAVRAGVASVMTAHVLFDALDAEYPATMSKPVLDGILRQRMGFNGVVVSDCLQMNAIAEHYGVGEAVVRGVNAGVDLFLVCHHAAVQDAAIDALSRAVLDGRVSETQIRRANERIDAMFQKFVRSPIPFDAAKLRTAEHLALVAEVERRAGQSSTAGRDPTAWGVAAS